MLVRIFLISLIVFPRLSIAEAFNNASNYPSFLLKGLPRICQDHDFKSPKIQHNKRTMSDILLIKNNQFQDLAYTFNSNQDNLESLRAQLSNEIYLLASDILNIDLKELTEIHVSPYVRLKIEPLFDSKYTFESVELRISFLDRYSR